MKMGAFFRGEMDPPQIGGSRGMMIEDPEGTQY